MLRPCLKPCYVSDKILFFSKNFVVCRTTFHYFIFYRKYSDWTIICVLKMATTYNFVLFMLFTIFCLSFFFLFLVEKSVKDTFSSRGQRNFYRLEPHGDLSGTLVGRVRDQLCAPGKIYVLFLPSSRRSGLHILSSSLRLPKLTSKRSPRSDRLQLQGFSNWNYFSD